MRAGVRVKKEKKLFFISVNNSCNTHHTLQHPPHPATPTTPCNTHHTYKTYSTHKSSNPSYPSSRLYILYNVYLPSFPLILSIKRKNACFPTLFSENICEFHENPLPLHPLLRTNAVTNRLQVQDKARKERVL